MKVLLHCFFFLFFCSRSSGHSSGVWFVVSCACVCWFYVESWFQMSVCVFFCGFDDNDDEVA